MSKSWGFQCLLCMAVVTCAVPGFGRENGQRKAKHDSAEPVRVEFYPALEEGKISVGVVPSNYSSLTMRIRNITNTPLQIKLPEVFAAVPAARVQAVTAMQMQGVDASLSSDFGPGYGNSQGLGASLATPSWVVSGREAQETEEDAIADQADSRYLTLLPGRFAQAEIPCFCLEFGQPDPNRRIPYVICPLEKLNDKPTVAELLRQFAKQGINQYVAQLAAWHLANNVPWPMLSQVQFPRTKNSRGHRVTQVELAAAMKLAETVLTSNGQSSLGGRRDN